MLTSANRIWTARFLTSRLLKTILHKKRNSEHFCFNHLRPEDHLHIADHTLLSITEAIFLKPVWNPKLSGAFFRANFWVRRFYPNWNPLSKGVYPPGFSTLQQLVETIFKDFLGDCFETFIQNMCMGRFRRIASRDK